MGFPTLETSSEDKRQAPFFFLWAVIEFHFIYSILMIKRISELFLLPFHSEALTFWTLKRDESSFHNRQVNSGGFYFELMSRQMHTRA